MPSISFIIAYFKPTRKLKAGFFIKISYTGHKKRECCHQHSLTYQKYDFALTKKTLVCDDLLSLFVKYMDLLNIKSKLDVIAGSCIGTGIYSCSKRELVQIEV